MLGITCVRRCGMHDCAITLHCLAFALLEKWIVFPVIQYSTDPVIAPSFQLVGETAVSQIAYDPYAQEYTVDNPATDSILRNAHLHGERGNRRIREVPSRVQSRQQVMVEEGCYPPAHSVGAFASALMPQARSSYRHPEGALPVGSNVSLLSDSSAFVDGEHIKLARDPMRNYDKSSDTVENPFLSRGRGAPRHAFLPSETRGGAIDPLSRGLGSLGLCKGTDMGAYGLQPLSGNGVLPRHMLHEGYEFPGFHCFASGPCELYNGASVTREQYEQTSPVENVEAGGSTDSADFMRRLVAAKSGSANMDALKDVCQSAVAVALPAHGGVEQHDQIENGSNFCLEDEDSAPYYIIYVGEKESVPAQTEGNSPGDEATKKRAPPVRFFDAGVEISMNGRPLSRRRKGRTPRRSPRSPKHDKEEAHKEGDEALRNLQVHQRSIWDQFVP